MTGKRYLHLATHGYFAPPGMRSALAPGDDRTTVRSFEGMSRTEAAGGTPACSRAWSGPGQTPRRQTPRRRLL